MALSANRDVPFFASQQALDLPVDDNVHIRKGAFVGLNAATGYARPLTAGDLFLGMAQQAADNTVDGHAGGGITVRLQQGIDIVHAISGVTQADMGDVVYASDDGTLTLTATSNSRVGRLVAIEGTGVARVRCEPFVS